MTIQYTFPILGQKERILFEFKPGGSMILSQVISAAPEILAVADTVLELALIFGAGGWAVKASIAAKNAHKVLAVLNAVDATVQGQALNMGLKRTVKAIDKEYLKMVKKGELKQQQAKDRREG